jgi:very-short-patch-repair endonuclease
MRKDACGLISAVGNSTALKFRRQFPIGNFIVDFCCHERKLIIEVDGGHHDLDRAKDAKREELLKARGYRVLRFWNNDVMDSTEGVVAKICESL